MNTSIKTVEEVQKAKNALELKLGKMLKKFEAENGVKVLILDVCHDDFGDYVERVEITAKI